MSWPLPRLDDDIQAPAIVVRIAAGCELRPVWRNELGGLTFDLGDAYVKWAPADSRLDLIEEARRMAWVRAWLPVPEVLDAGAADDGQWLVTAPLLGRSAVDPTWRADPATAVAAIGAGLRVLHDSAPVETCPFSWSVNARLQLARVGDEALARVAAPPPIDRLVVCHGDPCSPNTIVADDGRFAGLVNLGSLGVADRWADLAVATMATEWNYGPGWEQHLLDAYGIEPDPERTAYYRLLWDLA